MHIITWFRGVSESPFIQTTVHVTQSLGGQAFALLKQQSMDMACSAQQHANNLWQAREYRRLSTETSSLSSEWDVSIDSPIESWDSIRSTSRVFDEKVRELYAQKQHLEGEMGHYIQTRCDTQAPCSQEILINCIKAFISSCYTVHVDRICRSIQKNLPLSCLDIEEKPFLGNYIVEALETYWMNGLSEHATITWSNLRSCLMKERWCLVAYDASHSEISTHTIAQGEDGMLTYTCRMQDLEEICNYLTDFYQKLSAFMVSVKADKTSI